MDLDSGDELMPTKCPHSSHPSNLQDRTSARLLASPFHGRAESRVQIPELRVPMSPQMPHGPLSKHAAPHLRVVFCRVQSTITWLLIHSHDTSPSSAAAVFGRHCSLIHTIPAPQQRSAVCRGHSLIHMIPAPHQRLPCLEDTALLFTRYQPHISGCRVWKTLLSYSHDTSPTSAAAVFGRHCSFIHMIPASH